MTIEDVERISLHAIRAEAMRGSAGTAEKLGHYVRGVIHVNNEIVTMLRLEQSKTIYSKPFIYADTDSVKTDGPCRGGYTHTDSAKEDPDGT